MMILSLMRNYIPLYQWGFALTSSVRNAFLVRAGYATPRNPGTASHASITLPSRGQGESNEGVAVAQELEQVGRGLRDRKQRTPLEYEIHVKPGIVEGIVDQRRIKVTRHGVAYID